MTDQYLNRISTQFFSLCRSPAAKVFRWIDSRVVDLLIDTGLATRSFHTHTHHPGEQAPTDEQAKARK
jgi:hypothetical protein